MNSSAFALLVCLGAACAQTIPPAAPAPKMPDLPNDAVIAVLDDGTRLTMRDFKGIVAILPPQSQQLASSNPGAVLRWWAGMRKLANMAEADKLDQASPTKEQLEFNRTMIMGQAMMNSKLNTMQVEPADIAKYYEANKDQYKSVRVKALYVAFGDAAGAKVSRTETQAKDEAERLLAQIRAGADFVKLVKEHSDDETSRDKDGDFATFHKKENIPDAIEKAVFSLKKGEVSEPIRQPNGYYLLRVEEVSYVPEDQAQNDIVLTLRQERYNQWLGENTTGANVQFPNPAFPGTPAAPAGGK